MKSSLGYSKKYRENNKERLRLSRKIFNLKSKYNLSLVDYESMLVRQNNVCAICGGVERTKSLAVDHCHNTKINRGLLCQKCNRGIGCFNDNPKLLHNAFTYLTRF